MTFRALSADDDVEPEGRTMTFTIKQLSRQAPVQPTYPSDRAAAKAQRRTAQELKRTFRAFSTGR